MKLTDKERHEILVKIPKWNITEMCGYEPITTFWEDFSIADNFGKGAIKDTFDRAFREWKSDYKYLTELVMVLNHKSWEHYDKEKYSVSELYIDLFEKAQDYAYKYLKGEELSYFIRTTD